MTRRERVARALKTAFTRPIEEWNAAAGLPTRFPEWENLIQHIGRMANLAPDQQVLFGRQVLGVVAEWYAANGMAIVPREPTERMIDAAEELSWVDAGQQRVLQDEIYRAMIAAWLAERG